MICYPTETFYGIGIDPWNEVAREKLFELKGRASEKDLPWIAADRAMVDRFCDTSDQRFGLLADRFWPGPLTMVLHLLNSDQTVAVRVSSLPLAGQLSAALQKPIVSTSANLSGQPAVNDAALISQEIKHKVDVVIDAGITKGEMPSTIVSFLQSNQVNILRQGAVSAEDISRALQTL